MRVVRVKYVFGQKKDTLIIGFNVCDLFQTEFLKVGNNCFDFEILEI